MAHSVRGGAGIQSNCSRPSCRCLDKFLTCKKLWLAIVRLSHNWNRACVDFLEVGCFSFTAPEQSGKKSIWKCGWKNIKYKGQVGFFFFVDAANAHVKCEGQREIVSEKYRTQYYRYILFYYFYFFMAFTLLFYTRYWMAWDLAILTQDAISHWGEKLSHDISTLWTER